MTSKREEELGIGPSLGIQALIINTPTPQEKKTRGTGSGGQGWQAQLTCLTTSPKQRDVATAALTFLT